jgi:phage pi2 protein 07
MSETDKTKLRDAMIKDVMDEFDFDKVHKVMKYVGWEWGDCDGVPSTYSLIKVAEELLKDAYTKNTTVAQGGFIAKMENGSLELSFILESMTTFTEDYQDED